jgi:hypothetical protein
VAEFPDFFLTQWREGAINYRRRFGYKFFNVAVNADIAELSKIWADSSVIGH